MIIQRLFSEKKEKNHKKSNAVYAAGIGSGMVGAGIIGKTVGEARGIKEATEERLRSTDVYKKWAAEENKKDAKKHSKTLKNAAEDAVKKIGSSNAKNYLKGNKKSLALGVGASALGAGLVGKSIKMRKEEDSKAKKDDNSKK